MTESKSADHARATNASADAEAKPKSSWLRNTLIRVGSALVLIPIVIGLLFFAPPIGFTVFAFIAIAIASSELMAMVMPEKRLLQLGGVALTLGVAAVVLFEPRHLQATVVALPVAAMLISLLQPEPIETAARRVGFLIAGPLLLGGTLVTVPLLHRVNDGSAMGTWVLLSMLVAFGGDTGAYFAGKAFGRHKLYPVVSPKKTVEGALGGLVASAAAAVVLQLLMLPHVPTVHVAVLAVIAGIAGQAGDLCESLIKRSTGVKDSGKIMPGHGGLLDRIDALMFTSAVTWAYVSHWVEQAG